MPSDDALYEKYLKVCSLAERGEGGEAANARRIAEKMARKHPWLPDARRTQAQQAHAEEMVADVPDESGEPSSPSWSDIFSTAQSLYSRVSDFAETVSQARYGALLAASCKVSARPSRAGNFILGSSIPGHVMESLLECNQTQLRVFRNELLARLEDELNEVLGLDE